MILKNNAQWTVRSLGGLLTLGAALILTSCQADKALLTQMDQLQSKNLELSQQMTEMTQQFSNQSQAILELKETLESQKLQLHKLSNATKSPNSPRQQAKGITTKKAAQHSSFAAAKSKKAKKPTKSRANRK